MKAIKEARFDDALTDRHKARQLDYASRAVVERCRLALQGTDGRFDLFCIGQQLLAMRRQSIATGLSFSKRAVKSRLERPQTTLNSRLIYAQGSRSGADAATARDRQKITEVVPIEHLPTRIFAKPTRKLASPVSRHLVLNAYLPPPVADCTGIWPMKEQK
jgi:hypothetical protein